MKANKNTESNLLHSYSALAAYHPNIIILFSPNGEIISKNHSDDINELLGYSPNNKLDFKEIFSKHAYRTFESAFKRTLKGKSESHEIEINHKDSEILYLNTTFIPIKEGKNAVEGVYLIIILLNKKAYNSP
ncbi:hypothetical protein [Oceanobacillus sp. CF4.6]|uniref:hypothetical protein n=1 Tax=Oceanobacillus sp. CF4.6 TaxID=3373080 RepID=UPI003EE7A294